MSAPPPGDLESLLVTLSRLPPEQFKLAFKIVEAGLARAHELQLARERSRVARPLTPGRTPCSRGGWAPVSSWSWA